MEEAKIKIDFNWVCVSVGIRIDMSSEIIQWAVRRVHNSEECGGRES